MKKALNILLVAFLITSCGKIGELNKLVELEKAVKEFDAGNFEAAKTELENYTLRNQKNEYAWVFLGHTYENLEEDSLAMISYDKALGIKSEMEEALTGLGVLSRKAGDYDKAAEYYYKTIDINPNYAQAYSSLSVVELKRKRFEKSIEIGLKGYGLDKKDPVITSNLTVAYHYAGDSLNCQKFFDLSKKLGYRSLESLEMIINDEISILD